MRFTLISWKTSLAGSATLVCGATAYFELLPPKYKDLLMLFCTTLTAFGLIVAKDGNVTNTPATLATQGSVVSKDAPPSSTPVIAVKDP